MNQRESCELLCRTELLSSVPVAERESMEYEVEELWSCGG